jgi:hypothetical protein
MGADKRLVAQICKEWGMKEGGGLGERERKVPRGVGKLFMVWSQGLASEVSVSSSVRA